MKTDWDATAYVIEAIEANGTDIASRDEYDVEAIVDELYDLVGSYDFDTVEHDTFWEIVARHDIS